MAIFGNKENKEEKKSVDETVSDSGKKTTEQTRVSKTNTGNAFRILDKPLLSEKSYRLAPSGQYIFRVDPKANKISIRKAVEKVYDVHVTRVHVMNVRGKNRTYGKIQGRTSNWKKAIVTLKQGETIEGAQL